MKLLFTILMLVSFQLFADEVKIELNPSRPVAGEVFQAYFRIFTDSDEEPVINFSSSNIEVVSKSNQGISTSTIYANGKLTVTRELTVVYDLVAAKPIQSSIREITVQIGSKVVRHPMININVLKEPVEAAEVFVMADVPKKSLYLGEGIIVRYYLYSKINVSNLDIKKHPKLNNFLKRFLQEPERTERVTVDGQMYLRAQIYAAKIYPERLGELKIDPLELSVSYPSSRSGDPFGAFGLNRDYRTKTISSEVVKINVRPVPVPTPPHFTGLVGTHDFQIQFGKNKVIVNEPLELKLTVNGVGALENYEAPEILKHPSLEEFESNGDLKITSADDATKVFDYTFLPKDNLNLPARTLTLSYFDPNSEKFVTTDLAIPEITVAGAQLNQVKKDEDSQFEKKQDSNFTQPKAALKNLAAPLTIDEWTWKSWLPILNMLIIGLITICSIFWAVSKNKMISFGRGHEIPSSFKKNEFNLSDFTKWISPLIKASGKSPINIIKESPLSEESKRYFIDLLSANDYKVYSSSKPQMDYKYQSSHFKELGRYIESANHENFKQST